MIIIILLIPVIISIPMILVIPVMITLIRIQGPVFPQSGKRHDSVNNSTRLPLFIYN